jgi:hypothetical protein
MSFGRGSSICETSELMFESVRSMVSAILLGLLADVLTGDAKYAEADEEWRLKWATFPTTLFGVLMTGIERDRGRFLLLDLVDKGAG